MGVFFKREGLLFLRFLLWEFGCAAGKVGAGSMQALSLLFLKMAAVRKMTSSSGLFHFVTVAWPGLAGRNAIPASLNIIGANKRCKLYSLRRLVLLLF